jgi:hypothetical protein
LKYLRRILNKTSTAITTALFLIGIQSLGFNYMLIAQESKAKLTASKLATSGLTTQGLAQDAFLAKALYSVPKRVASNIGDDGAISVNREIGEGEEMYIEEQRYGGDLVQAGLATGNDAIVRTGLKVIEWGFKQQAQDGSFPNTGDAFHSVSMFVEGAARAFLSLRESGDSRYADLVASMVPRLCLAARWLVRSDVEYTGKHHDAPYTHRRWILAAALGQTAVLTQDAAMAQKAKTYAEEGLALQLGDGVNPEKGGYDVSYQCVGILQAERYFVVCPDKQLRMRIRNMIEQASNWELAMITSDGEVLVGNSTRIENEKSHSGKVKHVNTKELLQALSYATTITGNKKYREKAALVAHARSWY